MNKEQKQKYSTIFFDKEYVYEHRHNPELIRIINLYSIYLIKDIKKKTTINKSKSVKSNKKITRHQSRIINYNCNIHAYSYFQLYFDLYGIPISGNCKKTLSKSIAFTSRFEALKKHLVFMTWIKSKPIPCAIPSDPTQLFNFYYSHSVFFRNTLSTIYKYKLASKYYDFINSLPFYISATIRLVLKKYYDFSETDMIDISSKIDDLDFNDQSIWTWLFLDILYCDYSSTLSQIFLNIDGVNTYKTVFYQKHKILVDKYLMLKEFNTSENKRSILRLIRISDPFKNAQIYLNLYHNSQCHIDPILIEF